MLPVQLASHPFRLDCGHTRLKQHNTAIRCSSGTNRVLSSLCGSLHTAYGCPMGVVPEGG